MTDKIFVDGMRVTRNENAPDFVLCSVGIKMDDLIAFARQHHKNGWLNIQIKQSQGGKYYAELDTWEPQAKAPARSENPDHATMTAAPPPPADDFGDSDIPF